MGIKLVGEGAKVAPIWIVLAYFFHTTGELCLSPVGLSMVTKLAPQRLMSTLMGMWFLSISFAHYLAGAFSKLSAIEVGLDEKAPSIEAMLSQYFVAFETIIYFAAAMTLLLFFVRPFLKPVFIAREKEITEASSEDNKYLKPEKAALTST